MTTSLVCVVEVSIVRAGRQPTSCLPLSFFADFLHSSSYATEISALRMFRLTRITKLFKVSRFGIFVFLGFDRFFVRSISMCTPHSHARTLWRRRPCARTWASRLPIMLTMPLLLTTAVAGAELDDAEMVMVLKTMDGEAVTVTVGAGAASAWPCAPAIGAIEVVLVASLVGCDSCAGCVGCDDCAG